jgi:hypothetical protein
VSTEQAKWGKLRNFSVKRVLDFGHNYHLGRAKANHVIRLTTGLHLKYQISDLVLSMQQDFIQARVPKLQLLNRISSDFFPKKRQKGFTHLSIINLASGQKKCFIHILIGCKSGTFTTIIMIGNFDKYQLKINRNTFKKNSNRTDVAAARL